MDIVVDKERRPFKLGVKLGRDLGPILSVVKNRQIILVFHSYSQTVRFSKKPKILRQDP